MSETYKGFKLSRVKARNRGSYWMVKDQEGRVVDRFLRRDTCRRMISRWVKEGWVPKPVFGKK